ncbi:hypothetical protein JX266_014185 [Neoarthrinium moseri]|nr:hypothetical protein JX266_014185 [Neoarthrinium moseri]
MPLGLRHDMELVLTGSLSSGNGTVQEASPTETIEHITAHHEGITAHGEGIVGTSSHNERVMKKDNYQDQVYDR